ncbi:MAG: hypothetical protein JRJ15_10870 [Deltaproteobacteria bacterium]|nr:hypothetical protein [Deltaproteobacteria bacterium]
MGFKPGPIFREIFGRVLEAQLNNLVKTKEDEVRFVESHYDLKLMKSRMQGVATHEKKENR